MRRTRRRGDIGLLGAAPETGPGGGPVSLLALKLGAARADGTDAPPGTDGNHSWAGVGEGAAAVPPFSRSGRLEPGPGRLEPGPGRLEPGPGRLEPVPEGSSRLAASQSPRKRGRCHLGCPLLRCRAAPELVMIRNKVGSRFDGWRRRACDDSLQGPIRLLSHRRSRPRDDPSQDPDPALGQPRAWPRDDSLRASSSRSMSALTAPLTIVLAACRVAGRGSAGAPGGFS